MWDSIQEWGCIEADTVYKIWQILKCFAGTFCQAQTLKLGGVTYLPRIRFGFLFCFLRKTNDYHDRKKGPLINWHSAQFSAHLTLLQPLVLLLLCWKKARVFFHTRSGTNIMICMASRHLPVQNGYYIDSTFGWIVDGNMCYVCWFLASDPVIKRWLE